ncbi:MAG TPA: hypothetical protein VMG98_07610 [Verrucomicrobiae bacterium]|nr:hypothetical protein [Verrucomicrobiae bacterium]
MTTLLDEDLRGAACFPTCTPPDVELEGLVNYLIEQTHKCREAERFLNQNWSTRPKREHEEWYLWAVSIDADTSAPPSERVKDLVYRVLSEYPEVVGDFIEARRALRDLVRKLASNDIWSDALDDADFVDAAMRGTEALRSGHVTKVAWDDL